MSVLRVNCVRAGQVLRKLCIMMDLHVTVPSIHIAVIFETYLSISCQIAMNRCSCTVGLSNTSNVS